MPLDSQQAETLFKQLVVDEKNINPAPLLEPIKQLLNDNPANHKKLETIAFCIKIAELLISAVKFDDAIVILNLILKKAPIQLLKQSKNDKYAALDDQATKLKAIAVANIQILLQIKNVHQSLAEGRLDSANQLLQNLDPAKYEFAELPLRNLRLDIARCEAISNQIRNAEKQLLDEKTTLETLEMTRAPLVEISNLPNYLLVQMKPLIETYNSRIETNKHLLIKQILEQGDLQKLIIVFRDPEQIKNYQRFAFTYLLDAIIETKKATEQHLAVIKFLLANKISVLAKNEEKITAILDFLSLENSDDPEANKSTLATVAACALIYGINSQELTKRIDGLITKDDRDVLIKMLADKTPSIAEMKSQFAAGSPVCTNNDSKHVAINALPATAASLATATAKPAPVPATPAAGPG